MGYTGRLGGGSFHAFIGLDNLTDQKYTESVFINGINGEYFEPGLPQNWSARLTLGL